MTPSAAFAAESRYQGGNLFCAGGALKTATQSTARGRIEHRVDNAGGTTQWGRMYVGSSEFNAPWGFTFWTNSTGGMWSYAGAYGSASGTVVSGSLSRWCTA